MALFGNGGVGSSIRMQQVPFEVENGPGEETTDEGKIKRDTSLPELRS
jgi:hypothetical protein